MRIRLLGVYLFLLVFAGLFAQPIDNVVIVAQQLDKDLNAVADSSAIQMDSLGSRWVEQIDFLDYIPFDVVFTRDTTLIRYIDQYLGRLQSAKTIVVDPKNYKPKIVVSLQYRDNTTLRMAFCSNHIMLINKKYYPTDDALLDQIIPFLSEGSRKMIRQTDLY